MLYSNKEFINALGNPELQDKFPAAVRRACVKDGQVSEVKARKVLKALKDRLVARDHYVYLDDFLTMKERLAAYKNGESTSFNIGKFTRPWSVVPTLAAFEVPEGDFSVGVEVEYGFNSPQASSSAVKFIRNWRYVTVDFEGGTNGAEVTFAPTLYSKLNKNSQVFRYLRYLEAHQGDLYQHALRGGSVGTHINVGMPVPPDLAIMCALNDVLRHLSSEQKLVYFGRRSPFGYLYNRHRYVECKMFNSTADAQSVRRYINIAVSLMKLLYSKQQMVMAGDISAYAIRFSREEVVAALEEGYNSTAIRL